MAAWTYSNWITSATGSAARLTALRLHIKEISDYIRDNPAQYDIHGREVAPYVGELQKELESLRNIEEKESEIVGLNTGGRIGWTSGRARL